MTSTETKGALALEVEALSRIINECATAKVARLSYQGLELEFLSSDRPLELSKATEANSPWAHQPEITDVHASPKVLLTEEDKAMLREAAEMQLAIDDPLAYEEMQISEDVEHVRVRELDEGTENRRSEQVVHGSRVGR